MLFDLSSTIIALRNEQRSFDEVRLDGPVAEHRTPRARRGRPVATGRRWRIRPSPAVRAA